MIKRATLLLCLAMVMGCFAVPVALAETPPARLTGETFVDTVYGGPTSVACLNSGDFSFSASGVAAGPYPGTFTETGTGHVTQVLPVTTRGSVTAFSAAFTIFSATGDVLVKGTKSLLTPTPTNACYDGTNTGTRGTVVSYEATIFTPTGNYHDEGTSVLPTLFTAPAGTFLTENFASSLGTTVLISPTTKDECKDGGWETFPQFKNQGDCVSFVATGGKNPPAIG